MLQAFPADLRKRGSLRQPRHNLVKETDAIPPKTVYAELMEFGLAILFAIGVAWMYLTTPEQRQMIFGYIIFFTVIMSIIALFAGLGPSSAYGPYY